MNDTPSSDTAFHGPAEVVSHSAVGAVALCPCGHLHLNLQYLTLRFEPAAFRELAAMLDFAQRRIDGDARLRAVAAPPPEADPAAVH